MSPTELELLVSAAKYARLPLKNLVPSNPWGHNAAKSPMAASLQAAVEHLDPVQAAKWRSEVVDMSLEAVAAKAGLVQMNDRAREELMSLDPDFNAQEAAKAAQWEKDQLAQMEAKAREMALARGYNPDEPACYTSTINGQMARAAEQMNAHRQQFK